MLGKIGQGGKGRRGMGDGGRVARGGGEKRLVRDGGEDGERGCVGDWKDGV